VRVKRNLLCGNQNMNKGVGHGHVCNSSVILVLGQTCGGVRNCCKMLKILSIVCYFLMVGGFLGLFATGSVFSTSPLLISLQVLAILLFLWARVAFGLRSYHAAANPTAGGLVRCGPYRYIRHPIYAAFCLFSWAGIAAHWSWLSAACGGLVLGSAWLRTYFEEVLVAQRYPEYKQYAASTWRVIPYIY
jgi:protein-S-isoprenylcysteine O-methyltransferase Ste14